MHFLKTRIVTNVLSINTHWIACGLQVPTLSSRWLSPLCCPMMPRRQLPPVSRLFPFFFFFFFFSILYCSKECSQKAADIPVFSWSPWAGVMGHWGGMNKTTAMKWANTVLNPASGVSGWVLLPYEAPEKGTLASRNGIKKNVWHRA